MDEKLDYIKELSSRRDKKNRKINIRKTLEKLDFQGFSSFCCLSKIVRIWRDMTHI
jgi:hypothetical protein